MRRTQGSTRRWLAATALGAVTILGMAACGGPSHDQAPTSSGSANRTPADQAVVSKPATVATQPAGGVTDANPADPVTVKVTDGSITSMKLTSSTGAVVDGTLDDGSHTWTATEELGYGHTYTFSGAVTGADGEQVPIDGSFKTVQPRRTVSARINTGAGNTYGVAMPIAVTFSSSIPDDAKATVEKALSVKTSDATTGSWAWLSDNSVHWRPKEFWAPHTKVTVHAKLHGLDLGDGVYGASDLSTHFTIGKKQKITGNTDTHRLKLYAGGKLVKDYPTSYGLDSVNWRNTRSGVHVVMAESPTFSMTNERGGYEDVVVHWAVRISNNGEFIHAYPATQWAQGEQNVSHGCANLMPDRAKFLYDWVQIGDPVDIEGSNVKLSASDGDYYDWTVDWKKWQSLSALT